MIGSGRSMPPPLIDRGVIERRGGSARHRRISSNTPLGERSRSGLAGRAERRLGPGLSARRDRRSERAARRCASRSPSGRRRSATTLADRSRSGAPSERCRSGMSRRSSRTGAATRRYRRTGRVARRRGEARPFGSSIGTPRGREHVCRESHRGGGGRGCGNSGVFDDSPSQFVRDLASGSRCFPLPV